MRCLAAIDIGTVSVRLAVAEIDEAPAAQAKLIEKHSRICDLGRGLERTGQLAPDSIERVASCVEDFLLVARGVGAELACCTLTSAARDAANSAELIDRLEALGLAPEIIDGEVEGSLTFCGVARDFASEHILVVDNGGGSTEFACGSARTGVDWVRSTPLGCRRITERFFASDPPAPTELMAARNFCTTELAEVRALAEEGTRPGRMVVCGGTATSLVAMSLEMSPYDPSRVHLSRLPRAEVARLEGALAATPLEGRKQLVGLQPHRAPVIVAGALAVRSIMDELGFSEISVSESDLLAGLVDVAVYTLAGTQSPIGWNPALSTLR